MAAERVPPRTLDGATAMLLIAAIAISLYLLGCVWHGMMASI